jgi:hypothetical protein
MNAYITYKRYKGKGIGGEFNLRRGTKLTERDGFLYAPDGRVVCAATSENGWEHFHPHTAEGACRQGMLDALYKFYISGKGDGADFAEELWPGANNTYWKNLLRTMDTPELTAYYEARLGKRRAENV